MPEIEIEINLDTGKMDTEIKGIAGPSCEKTAEAIKQVFGKPARDEKTREYVRRVTTVGKTVKTG
jgi:hypothetical protein